jgi:hypothetical protein
LGIEEVDLRAGRALRHDEAGPLEGLEGVVEVMRVIVWCWAGLASAHLRGGCGWGVKSRDVVYQVVV